MCVTYYDFFHRVWNDIKLAAKASKGFFYAVLLKFSLVFNLNYGPFGKGAWFHDKKAWLEYVEHNMDAHHQFFRDRASGIAADLGVSDPVSHEDYCRLWTSFISMESFRIKGPLSKLMRWFSFCEAYVHNRKDMHGLKLVLDYHYSTTIEDEVEAQHNIILPMDRPDPKQELIELKKSLGGLRLAAKLITPEGLWNVDCLFHVCHELWQTTGKHSKEVTTAAHFKDKLLSYKLGSWVQPLVATVRSCTHSPVMFQTLGLHADLAHNACERTELMVDFMLHIISNRAVSMVCHEVDPPFRYSQLLSSNPTDVATALAEMKADWLQLMDIESAAAASPEDCRSASAWLWRQCLPIRAVMLAFDICEYDASSDLGQEAMSLFNSLLDVIGDSKCIEDTHQHLRHLGRIGNNHELTSRAARMFTCINSPVLSQRGIPKQTLSSKHVIYQHWKSKGVKVAFKQQTQTSSVMPDEAMLKIMKEHNSSPTPSTMFESTSATHWLFDVWPTLSASGVPMDAAWQSILVAPHSILRCTDTTNVTMTLQASPWGVLCWKLHFIDINIDNDMPRWKLDITDHPTTWHHIIDASDYEVIPYTILAPIRGLHGCILLEQAADPVSLLGHGLLNGVAFTKKHIAKLLGQKGIQFKESNSKAVLLHQLIMAVFSDKPDQDAALAAQAQSSSDVKLADKVDKDPDLDMVVEAADEDTAKADEITVLKKARAKKQQHIFRQGIITRQKQRQTQAKAKAKARGKPKAKAKTKAKAKAKATARSTRLSRQRQGHRSAAAPAPESGDAGVHVKLESELAPQEVVALDLDDYETELFGNVAEQDDGQTDPSTPTTSDAAVVTCKLEQPLELPLPHACSPIILDDEEPIEFWSNLEGDTAPAEGATTISCSGVGASSSTDTGVTEPTLNSSGLTQSSHTISS